ncbi:MAG: hypothetical protein ABII22_02850 [Candidatus Micrarchaeota archaeon]
MRFARVRHFFKSLLHSKPPEPTNRTFSSYLSEPDKLPSLVHEFEPANYEAGLDPIAARMSGPRVADLSPVELANKSFLHGLVIGTEVAHHALGLTEVSFHCRPVDDVEMVKFYCKGTLPSDQDTFEIIAKENPAVYDGKTQTVLVNYEQVTTPEGAAQNAIHETLHQYVGFDTGDMSCADKQYLKEGGTEYASLQILQTVTQDPQVDTKIGKIAYEAGVDFFQVLGQIVSKDVIVSGVLNGDFGAIAKAYEDKLREANIQGPSMETLLGLVSSNPVSTPWDVAQATSHLRLVVAELREKKLLPQDQPLSITLVDPKGEVRNELQARTLVETTTVLEGLTPGNQYYVSADLGIIAYVRPEFAASAYGHSYGFSSARAPAISVPIGGAWAGFASSVSFPNLTTDPIVSASNSGLADVHEEPQATRDYDPSVREIRINPKVAEAEDDKNWITCKEPSAEEKETFKRSAIEWRLKLADVSEEEFQAIETFEDLFEHLHQVYPAATNYYLQLLTQAVSITIQLESNFCFPPSPNEIARRAYREALDYEKEYLVLGSVWDLTEHISQDIAKRFSPRDSKEYAKFKDKYGVTLDPKISEAQFDLTAQQAIIRVLKLPSYTGKKEADCLFELACQELRRFHIFDPTNSEVAMMCNLILFGLREVFHFPFTTSNLRSVSNGVYGGWTQTMDLGVSLESVDGSKGFFLRDRPSPEKLLENARKFMHEGRQQ